MRWQEFAAAASPLADALVAEFDRLGVVLVGTMRLDGSPRISPVEPVVLGGELYLDMMWRSMKARDLLRDPRCEVHAAVDDRLGPQLKVWGHVQETSDEAERSAYAAFVHERLGWDPYPQHHLFKLDLSGASWISYGEDCPPGWLRIRTWTPAAGYRERGPEPPPGSGESPTAASDP